MFGNGKKRKGNGNAMMYSLVGVGIGAAAYGLMRGRNNGGMNNMMQPIQKAFNQMNQE
ncbi:hypothetical protein [Bacillus suaedae]|uniref:Uncharacterized protein n=1 Tax=Halalkalibacter suaedae TaxID=2822140 RepID=A0A940WVA2_9BACI|nr:hypothetical protein [Bacillus suaedae]MBP3953060.1 hypothetical protein [Bacillus suaedae]